MSSRAQRPILRLPRLVAALAACAAGGLACTAAAAEEEDERRFVDPEDGKFDVSNFLDTAYGFLPVVIPITEPAVGYGAGAALVFIDRPPVTPDGRFHRPNMTVAGGLRTENGTDGLFGGHLGTWRDGRLRTLAAVADMDVNLEFFGLGGDRIPGSGVEYTVEGTGGVLGGSWRLGASNLWLGARYALFETEVSLRDEGSGLPGVSPADFGLELAAITPTVTLDRRNNFFTPTDGWYLDLSMPLYRESVGSDRDFEKATLTGMYFQPLSDTLYLGVRSTVKYSSDGTPFYLRPYVALRGIQALRYQGEESIEAEVEFRWQFNPRFSAVFFGGAGVARGGTGDEDESAVSGGTGFRYLIARRHGLHVGLDVAAGPDGGAVYVIVGSAWMRP